MVAPAEQPEVDVLARDGRPELLSPRVRRVLTSLLLAVRRTFRPRLRGVGGAA